MDGGADADSGEVLDSTLDTAESADAPSTDSDATSADAQPDSPVDSPTDALDAGDGSDGPYIPPGLLAYPSQYAEAFCQATLHCCDSYDAGAYNVASCVAQSQTGGWEATLPPTNIYSRGNLTFDPDAGAGCIAALGTVPCTALTASENSSIVGACSSVIHGTIAIGGYGCSTSWECVPGAFCDSTADGGLCSALVGSGAPCGTKAPNDEMCAYLSTHDPALFCNFIANPNGGATCAPVQADNSVCIDSNFIPYDLSCASELCGDLNTCGSSATNFNTGSNGQCAVYLITDAGGGG